MNGHGEQAKLPTSVTISNKVHDGSVNCSHRQHAGGMTMETAIQPKEKKVKRQGWKTGKVSHHHGGGVYAGGNVFCLSLHTSQS